MANETKDRSLCYTYYYYYYQSQYYYVFTNLTFYYFYFIFVIVAVIIIIIIINNIISSVCPLQEKQMSLLLLSLGLLEKNKKTKKMTLKG